MSLGDIRLCEIRQAQQEIMLHDLAYNVSVKQLISQTLRVVSRAWEWREVSASKVNS